MMSKAAVPAMYAQLAAWVHEWAIDPHDAIAIARESVECPTWEDMGDYLDGAGYPELAEQAYALA